MDDTSISEADAANELIYDDGRQAGINWMLPGVKLAQEVRARTDLVLEGLP